MKRVRRYVAVITGQRGREAAQKINDAVFLLCGGLGVSDMQISIMKEEEWGLILRVRASKGTYIRHVPLALSLVGANGSYMQCVATSGTIKSLMVKLKELGMLTKDGMK